MNFKEIRLAGFKSFADKTSIKFEDGVTCIVGPNGCGKSNVADAVRWVLGEQSAKTLRGSSMQDVIFNGTQERRALSFCEVTLVFDNASHLFDIEYDEVAMTRRLYRSGESEYLLNGHPCRLKDIVALLHGVGIGKEGYSIIGQGKVEQIMNAKPEERRAIFEEATGVMQFKLRKGEIERKLESAGDNLTVFIQRMDEAEKQLKPLEKQAETAKKYREYSEELKHEEVNTYLCREENFEQETARHRAVISEATERLSSIEEELGVVDGEEASARERASEEDERLRSLNERLRVFEVGLEHKSGDARVISERISSYKRRLAAATEDVEYSIRRTKEIEAESARFGKRKEENERRAAEIEKRMLVLGEKLADANARLLRYEQISDERRASELSSVEDLADVRANVSGLSAQRNAASERIEEVRAAIRKAETRGSEYGERLEACRKEKAECERFLDAKGAQEEELNERLKDLTLSGKKLSQDLVECNTSIANLTNNLELYRNLKNRFDGYRDSVRNLQLVARKDEEIGKKIKGAIADIVRTEQKYEVAIETAFGGAMQNLVTATSDDARFLIEYLKKTGGGVVTFLPVSGMAPRANSGEAHRALHERGALGLADELVHYDAYYDNVIKNLLGNTLVCDTIASATSISKKYPHAFRIVTLDGDVITTNGAMTGGSRRRESGNLLAGERHIKECEEGIAKKTALAKKIKEAIENAERDREETEKEMEAFRLKVQEETANFAALSQRELALSGLVSDTERDLEEYRGLLERLEKRVGDLENEVLSSSESEDLINRIRTEAAAEAAAQEAQSAGLKEEQAKLSEELQSLRVESASLATAREAEEEGERRRAEERRDLLARVDSTRAEIAQAKSLIESLKAEEEKVALTEEEQKAVASIREGIAAMEKEKRETAERQAALGDKKRALLAEQQNLGDKKHASELEISRAEVSLENMRQRIDEAYGLTLEGARELRDENYDLSQSAANITSLRRRIGALGPVNQNAEEDYEQLLSRYNEMAAEREDLEKGISDLSGALDELKNTMQQQFDSGFAAINKNFTRTFKELFGGGKAEMQLDYTDCDDPLDAGVEIIACPPGKKLTKISLLSGGERTLTAIAILFAILRTKPMPFCILDEIEAALDEANVDRFAKYLKNFSQETQFIVITHRKQTMNEADILFGVTMEEKGVSKIVSVKLSEVESRLGGDTVMP